MLSISVYIYNKEKQQMNRLQMLFHSIFKLVEKTPYGIYEPFFRVIYLMLLLHISIINFFKFREMFDAVDATVLLFCHACLFISTTQQKDTLNI